MWEAEIGRFVFQDQPRQKFSDTPTHVNGKKLGIPVIPTMAGSIQRKSKVQAGLGKKSKTLFPK
jgi:hypothetical protein